VTIGPTPVAAAPVEEVDPVLARRLGSALGGGGTVDASGSAAATDSKGRGGLDLSVTRAAMARARRLQDLPFTVPKGTYLPCVLNTAIVSDQSGMVACTLPEDIYGASGTVVLLDRGSQLLGEYRNASLTYGVRRVYVVWDRVRTPTGVIVDIASPGTGPLGQAGIGGRIDNHYLERIGIPVLLSAFSFGTNQSLRDQLSSDERNWVQETSDDTLQGVLGQYATIRPTLSTAQGARIGILVARDLDLSGVYRLGYIDGR